MRPCHLEAAAFAAGRPSASLIDDQATRDSFARAALAGGGDHSPRWFASVCDGDLFANLLTRELLPRVFDRLTGRSSLTPLDIRPKNRPTSGGLSVYLCVLPLPRRLAYRLRHPRFSEFASLDRKRTSSHDLSGTYNSKLESNIKLKSKLNQNVYKVRDLPARFEEAVVRLGGDIDLLHEMASITSEDLPQVRAATERAIADGDCEQSASGLHQLKGMLIAFESGRVTSEIQDMLDAARKGDALTVRQAFGEHRDEIDELIAEIAKLASRFNV